METTYRLRKTALAASVALLMGVTCNSAMALSLGRLTVQSALGEPLRAEIDIPDIGQDEADTLRSTVATPEAFAAAGLDFNAALTSVRVSLQRRADGRAYLRVTSDKAINEPFVDLVVEAQWASGRMLRDYTMLFDPPNLRAVPAAAPTAAQVGAATPSSASAKPSTPTTESASAKAAPAAKPRTEPVKAANATDGKQVTVRAGETASKIADANKLPDISLDQMLVAMLRQNPDAFINGNLNRLKSGAVLNLPSSQQASETTKADASRAVVAQSRDFGEFRRQLGAAAPVVASQQRESKGAVQGTVAVAKPAAATPDKLTLSKPSSAPAAAKAAAAIKAAEDKIAAERQAKEAAARAAELERNVAELNRLKAASAAAAAAKAPSAAAPAPAAAPAAATAAAPAAAPQASAALTVPVAAPATPSASTPAPAAKPSAPAVKPAASKPKAAAAPVEEPGLLDTLMDQPLLAAGGLGVLGLGGLALYMKRRRKPSGVGESSFLDSHIPPDSFFGASGGEQVDTSNEAAPTGSSMIYSPSQLDTAGDVDPVAEADVYLAYGRDQQAEEILRDALQVSPTRLTIHNKLADIYYKRGDAEAFNAIASAAYAVTDGTGAEWDHIAEMGRQLDAGNSLYGGSDGAEEASAPPQTSQPASAEEQTPPAPADMEDPLPVIEATPAIDEPDTEPAVNAAQADRSNVDLDFDLDFDLEAGQVQDNEPSAVGVLHESNASSEPMALYDAPSAEELAPAANLLDVPDDLAAELNATPVSVPKLKSYTAVSTTQPLAPTPVPPSIDLSGVSLDLDDAPVTAPAALEDAEVDNLDPLATKLALAREFQSIGDTDGAHALAEEVHSQASGALKADAKKFLTELGFGQTGFESSKF